MSKGILEFNLLDGEDKMAHMRAIKSTDMAIVLHEIFYNLPKRIEMGIDVEKYKTPYEVSEAYRMAIRELMEEQCINLDELIN